MSGLIQLPPQTVRALENQRRAGTSRGRAALGAFGVEGVRMIRRGLRAGWQPRQLLVADTQASRPEILELTRQVEVVVELPEQLLLSVAQGRASGCVQALFELPTQRTVAEILAREPRALFLVLLEVDEPGNVGALIRTALASGADAVLFAGGTDPFHPKAVRTSLGSLFRIPLIAGVEAPSAEGATPESAVDLCLNSLHAANVHTLATVPRGGEGLLEAKFPDSPLAVLMGHEGQGLPEHIQKRARQRISIEQSEEADSYSVNAAAAICLFNIRRRRTFPSLTLRPDLTRQVEP